ncbi:cupin-like domain-containing protein [Podospora didyma]|uniref:Cupin-like domain-containing protein n=1 Tax=Podospora didyma TaxID=330526 RepID=A0AAE0KLN3_9PEZI|nr:cupin-like domain-containing protein [Podospora didyma]
MEETRIEDPITELIVNYNELNRPVVEELGEEPTPLEFMRYVAKNTPFVARGAADNWKATQEWSAQFIKNHLHGETVNVAVTAAGNADAPTRREDGTVVFATPWEEQQPIGEFLDYIIQQEMKKGASGNHSEVRYAQTQNDNLRNEYASLFGHVQKDIPFARIALETEPDAINLWIGNSLSTTALHKDNYENIYVQIIGQKHFVLLPPHCQPCVNEQDLPSSQYVRSSSFGGLELVDMPSTVPFATWDPERPAENATAYSSSVQPWTVTLNPGDMLYLPCMW